jgi:hypothetical protein
MESHTLSHALAARINIQLLKLLRLQAEMRNLERDIEGFLHEYFTALEQYLRPFLTHSMQYPVPVQEEMEAQLDSMEKLLKQLYRHLAKHFHPDGGAQTSPEMMSRINTAYAQKELGSLLLFTASIAPSHEGQHITASHADLMHYYQMITRLTLQTEQHLRTLEQSEANRLRKHMLMARLNGMNFIEEIAIKLQKKYRAAAFSV